MFFYFRFAGDATSYSYLSCEKEKKHTSHADSRRVVVVPHRRTRVGGPVGRVVVGGGSELCDGRGSKKRARKRKKKTEMREKERKKTMAWLTSSLTRTKKEKFARSSFGFAAVGSIRHHRSQQETCHLAFAEIKGTKNEHREVSRERKRRKGFFSRRGIIFFQCFFFSFLFLSFTHLGLLLFSHR